VTVRDLLDLLEAGAGLDDDVVVETPTGYISVVGVEFSPYIPEEPGSGFCRLQLMEESESHEAH